MKHPMDDDLNRRLVAELVEDGRVTHAELAERLGVSRPTVIDRVKRLEAEGILEGYAAKVSPASVQKPVIAYVAVRYKAENDEVLEQAFWRGLEKELDVLEAHSVAGEDCLLLKIVAETPQGLQERLRRIRMLGPHVTTRTTVVLQTHFQKAGPSPFPLEPRPAIPLKNLPLKKVARGMMADLLEPPYYAVIFTSRRTAGDRGYDVVAERMVALASQQPGFLGVESVRDAEGLGITVSYWKDEASIQGWKAHAEHGRAQALGKETWYSAFRLRVAKVERVKGMG